MKHEHKWTKWCFVDIEGIFKYRMCKCGKVEFKGNYKNWLKRDFK